MGGCYVVFLLTLHLVMSRILFMVVFFFFLKMCLILWVKPLSEHNHPNTKTSNTNTDAKEVAVTRNNNADTKNKCRPNLQVFVKCLSMCFNQFTKYALQHFSVCSASCISMWRRVNENAMSGRESGKPGSWVPKGYKRWVSSEWRRARHLS